MTKVLSKVKASKILFEVLMVMVSLVYVIPAWLVLINSFKPSKEAFRLGLNLPETKWCFENYAIVFIEGNILRALFNGVFVASITVFVSCIISSMAAFVISRRNTGVTNAAYGFFIGGIIIPSSIVPVYLLFKTLRLTNTYTGMILLFISLTIPLSILLYSGFIKSVPRELDEAAIIDGCGSLRLFFKIVFPLLKPVTATAAIFHFIGIWNDIINQLFFSQSGKWMLPLSVYKFYGTYTYDWNLVFADIIITMFPLITIYLLAQKYIISGLTMGAVKG